MIQLSIINRTGPLGPWLTSPCTAVVAVHSTEELSRADLEDELRPAEVEAAAPCVEQRGWSPSLGDFRLGSLLGTRSHHWTVQLTARSVEAANRILTLQSQGTPSSIQVQG